MTPDYDPRQNQGTFGVGSLYKEAVKTSWLLKAGSMKAWDRLIAGEGIRSPGLFGFRSTLAGQGASSGKISSLNILRQGLRASLYISGKMRGDFSAYQKFNRSGLFGYGGLFASKDGTGIRAGLARYLGGQGFMRGVEMPQVTYTRDEIGRILNYENRFPTAIRSGLTAESMSKETFEEAMKGMQKGWKGDIKAAKQLLGLGVKTTPGQETMALAIRKTAQNRLLGTLGKGFGIYLWATMGFSAAAWAARGVVNKSAALSDRLTQELSRLANNKMEFGGKLERGFFSSGAATERQRALSAIQDSRINARQAIGNEAAYQHVGNTW